VIIVKFQRFFTVVALFLALIAITRTAAAQSTDQSLPTPVLSNEINGKIAALDLGDARLTRHFYAFEGVPGDLLVTLSSRNLNGDIDIFTAITFRPVMKIPMYASGNTPSAEVTKGFYLRARQVLILRVEARSPNDDVGTYRVRFGGAYEPFSGGIPVAEESTEQSTEVARGENKTRLSSVGARIEEPPGEAKPKPAEKSAEETASNSSSSAKATKPKSSRTAPTRTARGRGRPTRSKPASTESQPKPEPAKTEAAQTETLEPKKEPAPAEEKPAAAPEVKTSPPEKPAAQETVAPQPGARLIIEEKDGTKIDRPMSTVRRVVIEGGTIVIVLKTGRIERIPMSVVAKMSIEP
jgi:hypothetical protein